MNTYTLTLRRKKETKYCVVYEAEPTVGTPAVITSVYVQKWAVGPATSLRLVVEPLTAMPSGQPEAVL